MSVRMCKQCGKCGIFEMEVLHPVKINIKEYITEYKQKILCFRLILKIIECTCSTKRLFLYNVVDINAEILAVLKVLHNLFTQMSDNHYNLFYTVFFQRFNLILKQRLTVYRHHRLRNLIICYTAKSAALSPCHNNRNIYFFHLFNLSTTSSNVGILTIPPLFSTHRLATAFPYLAISYI